MGIAVILLVWRKFVVNTLQHQSFVVYTSSHTNSVSTTSSCKQPQDLPIAARYMNATTDGGNTVGNTVSLRTMLAHFTMMPLFASSGLHGKLKEYHMASFIGIENKFIISDVKIYWFIFDLKNVRNITFHCTTVVLNL